METKKFKDSGEISMKEKYHKGNRLHDCVIGNHRHWCICSNCGKPLGEHYFFNCESE